MNEVSHFPSAMSEQVATAATVAAAGSPVDAGSRIESALSDPTLTSPTATVPVRPVAEEKPSLPVLLCFLSFFAYCFIAWYVTSRVERAALPELAQLEADTNSAVSHTHDTTVDDACS